jgi:hypothetical protein
MRTSVAFGIVGIVGITAFVTWELSQKPQPAAQPAAMYNTGCCPMMMGDNQAGPNTMNMMDMMQQMGMKPEMMDRMQLLMRTGVFVDSPAALQVQKDKLQLSQEQAGKLNEIEKEARQKALAVLTPEQRTALGAIPDRPLVMIEMCPQMMATMCAGAGRPK